METEVPALSMVKEQFCPNTPSNPWKLVSGIVRFVDTWISRIWAVAEAAWPLT
jgi:hypothetical protein